MAGDKNLSFSPLCRQKIGDRLFVMTMRNLMFGVPASPSLNSKVLVRQSLAGLIEVAEVVSAPDRALPTSTVALRRFVRTPVRIRALLYAGDTFQSVLITNISAGGAGLQDCNSMIRDDTIVVRFLNGRSIEAKVCWWLAGACGIQFSTVLAPNDPLLAGKMGTFNGPRRFLLQRLKPLK